MKGTEQRGSMARYTGLQSVAAFFLKSGSMGHAEGGRTGGKAGRGGTVIVTGRGCMGHQVMTAIACRPFVSDPLKR